MHGSACPSGRARGQPERQGDSVRKRALREMGVCSHDIRTGTESPSLALREAKNKSGFVFLEKHILKKEIQRNKTTMYRSLQRVSGERLVLGGAASGGQLGF